MNKVLITGGLGFIGSNLVKYLIKKKYFVINVDKSTYSSNSYLLKGLKKKNYIFYKLDINNSKKYNFSFLTLLTNKNYIFCYYLYLIYKK